jgi:hypothetical protein
VTSDGNPLNYREGDTRAEQHPEEVCAILMILNTV